MTEFLNDKYFLKFLEELKIKEQYVRITILSWSEEPISEIQGKVLSGSINLDGSSSMRRTGNLTLYADSNYNDLSTLNTDIAINKKIKIEMGIKNTVPPYIYQKENDKGIIEDYQINYQERYGQIVWFPLGIYIMFDPSISHSESGVTISVELRDKMCLLNGDVGGIIPAATTFSEMEYVNEEGKKVITIPTMYQIIEELVNHFGNEPLSKIIISDLDTRAKQVVKYIGREVIYHIKGFSKQTGTPFYKDYDSAVAAAKALGGDENNVAAYEYGQDIGFIQTDFTYPGELVSNPGDTITSVLDKIIEALGNFEYFYDLDGNFHFQEIKNYMNTSFTTEILNKLNSSPDYHIDFSQGTAVYTFDDVKSIMSVSNSMTYSNIKNDFVVWGNRLSVTKTKIPIRYHLAIDKRPQVQGYDSNNQPYFGIHENIVLYLDDTNNYAARKAKEGEASITVYTRDYREELYYQGIESYNLGLDAPYYCTELYSEWPKLYDLQAQTFKTNIAENPSSLDFFLDIIDSGSEIGQYGVDNIGRRSMVVQEDAINSVFERDIPDLVFLNKDKLTPQELQKAKDELNAKGQNWVQIDDTFDSLLASGGVLNSAYYRVTELLYQYTNMNNAISISSMPVYYLEPNTRIKINDEKSGVFGEYVINNISLPLDITTPMEISAYKAIEKI